MKLLIIAVSLFTLHANATLPSQSDPELGKTAGTSYCPDRMKKELAKNSNESIKNTVRKGPAVR